MKQLPTLTSCTTTVAVNKGMSLLSLLHPCHVACTGKLTLASGDAGEARPATEEEPIEEPGRSFEAEPICQDCTPTGAAAPGLPSLLLPLHLICQLSTPLTYHLPIICTCRPVCPLFSPVVL